MLLDCSFFFFKQKTAYEMRISDLSSDVCSSDLSVCLPYAEHFLPNLSRDYRELLRIHAAGLRHVVDNEDGLDIKNRAYHLSAELYLLQHSCHWFCKSRAVANARLMMRHQVTHQKVLESVSATTRSAYMRWLENSPATDATRRL